jgi:putative transposase
MSFKYKPGEDGIAHFVTFTVVGWIDVFSREIYKETFIESLQYCISHKGLDLHAWVIMTNHVHLIISTKENSIAAIVRDLKKYTAIRIIQLITENPTESRKVWILNQLHFVGKNNNNNKDFQFWKQGYHPIELNTPRKLRYRLDYLHENPVKAGHVWQPQDYKYSSATDYYTNRKGLVKVEVLQT